MSGENNSKNDNTSQWALDFARKEGLRVVVPKGNQLLIDIDSDAAFARFQEAYGMLSSYHFFDPQGYRSNPSKSGGERRHVTVNLGKDVTPTERVLLQTLLGSDWKREFLSFRQITMGDAVPTLFFEKV